LNTFEKALLIKYIDELEIYAILRAKILDEIVLGEGENPSALLIAAFRINKEEERKANQSFFEGLHLDLIIFFR